MPPALAHYGKLTLWWSAPAALTILALVQIPLGVASTDAECAVTTDNWKLGFVALPFILIVAVFVWRRKELAKWSVWLKGFLWCCALGSVFFLLVLDLALGYQGWGGCDGMGWP
ncbi:MAG: hypothetical protein ACRDKE_07865 [Solirubrobacterales bacterium]